MPRVGLVGIGLVGTAMAERLIAAGYEVVGYDIASAACERLATLGGQVRESASDIARECETVLISLPTSADAHRVLRECSEVIGGGQLFIDTTTGGADEAKVAGSFCAARDARYVEATILGSSELVRSGTALVMLGGDAASRTEAATVVEAFASNVVQVGELGDASRMKLAVNLVLGLNRAALAEGLAFAEAIGLDPRMTLDVLRAGAAYSRVMDTKGEKMLRRDFTPEARLAQHHKDVGLIREAALARGLALPLTEAHDRLLDEARQAGYAESDNSAIIAAYDLARRSGLPAR
jgi:3-hydroxyisobutyrate dehydrogenase-like beta-hydroxyacid dehydrogenase